MFRPGNTASKVLALLVAVLLCASSVTVCLADAYSEYNNAYKALTANGLVDANIDVTLTMEGETSFFTGKMKIDTDRNVMYYELTSGGETVTYFVSGQHLYMIQGDHKVYYDLGEPVQPSGNEPEPTEAAESGEEGEEGEEPAIDEWNVTEFLKDFSAVLEPGQIRELGLLEPLKKAVVTNTTASGSVYTLDVAEVVVQAFLNQIVKYGNEDEDDEEEGEAEESVQFTDLKNFVHTATVNKGMVTSATFAGDLTVHVPGKYFNGEAKDYQMKMDILITFNNPGMESQFELPSTDGFEPARD